MNDDWTPTTDEVRYSYAVDVEGEFMDPINATANQKDLTRRFDRWLASHDAQVSAETLRAVAADIGTNRINSEQLRFRAEQACGSS